MAEIYVILARPQKPLNIGSVVRLANNFGASGVRLTGVDEFDRHQACITAPNLEKQVSQVQCYSKFADAIHDLNLTFGFTARHRKYQGTIKYLTPNEAAITAFQKHEQAPKIGIVGGAEDSGLLNEEINQLDYAVTIPTSEFQSLNLAMSMSIALYEFYQLFHSDDLHKIKHDFNDELANPDDRKMIEQLIGDYLAEIDFYKTENSDANYVTISRLLKKLTLTKQENRYLLAILKHIIYLTNKKTSK